jgi:ABC-2 type transport system permease protein
MSATTEKRASYPGGGTRALRAIYIIWYRDIVRFWRDRARLIASLAQPLLYLLVFGTGLSSAMGAGGGGGSGSYQAFIFPGVIGMTVLFSSIFSAMSIIWDREFGFLKEVLVAPIDRSSVAIGKALGGATQATIQGLVLLVLAPLIRVPLTPRAILLMIPCTFLLAFALSAMGVAIASKMRSMQGFQMIMNLLMMPIFFLSGALFPLTGLPKWLGALTRLDPASYGIDPLRRVVLGSHASAGPGPFAGAAGLTVFGRVLPIAVELAVLTLFGFVMLAVAIRNFRVPD